MIISVTGFSRYKDKYFAGTNKRPYAIGQPYRHKSSPKPTSIAISRYFVVTDEIIIPIPTAKKIICITDSGTNKIIGVTFKDFPPTRIKRTKLKIVAIHFSLLLY